MKIPRPRLTIRRLMIAVAAAGLLSWSATMVVRWRSYGRLAARHEAAGASILREVDRLRRGGISPAAVGRREAAMHAEFGEAERYRRARSRPWVSISSIPARPG